MTREIRSSSYPDNKQNCYMVPYSMEMNRYFPEILRGKDTFFIRCEEEASLILSSFSEMPLLLPLSGFDRRTFDLNCASTLPFPSQPGKRSIFSRRDPPAEWTFTPPFVLLAAGHRHSGKNRGRSALPRFIHGLAPSISLFQRFIRGAPLKRFCR